MHSAHRTAIVLRRKLLPLPLLALLLYPFMIAGEPARTTLAFDENWRFQLGDTQGAEQPLFRAENWRAVDLPHDWSAEHDFSPTNASGTGFLPGGTAWYRKEFTLPEKLRGRRVSVEFDGVYRNSDIWINGTHLGHRPSGYIGFDHDLTAHLRFGSNANVIAVRVERDNVADSRWYTGSGIYRHVRIVDTDPVHIAPWGVFVTTPQFTAGAADVHTRAEVVNGSNDARVLRIQTRVSDTMGVTVSEAEDTHALAAGDSYVFSTWQKVPDPELWSPQAPNLYTLTTRVLSGRTLLDEVRTPFGIRVFHFDPDSGFFLNGTNLLLKGVCLHHDAGVVGAAVPGEVLKRRLQLVKDLGANAVRCSHNPMAPELYSLCDALGLMVMDEAFDEWEIGKRKWEKGRNTGTAERFGYAEAFEEWAERDLSDMVRQHRNHPSIIMWSIGNEIDYPTDPYVHPESRIDQDFSGFSRKGMPSVTRLSVVAPQLIAAVKREDPTRPITMALANVLAANGTGLAAMLDVAGYNYQEKEYAQDHRDFPHRVIYGSENSKRADSWRVVRDRDHVSGLFLWVGFDFLGEANAWPWHGSTAGVFDRCGFPKTSAFQFEAFWKQVPVVRLVSSLRSASEDSEKARAQSAPHWTWDARPGDPTTVTAYSNCDELDLLLNGISLGRKEIGDAASARWEVPYEQGRLVAIGFVKGVEQARDELRTAGRPTHLVAKTDSESLQPGGVAHLVLLAVDSEGIVAPHTDIPITLTVTGAGRLLGLDNGKQNDPTPLRSPTRVPAVGRLLAIIQAGKSQGTLTVQASAPGIEPLELAIAVE